MMNALDVQQLAAELKKTATEILQKDITKMKGFSERQVKAISQQAVLITDGIKSGQITEETADFFSTSLDDMIKNFARTLKGLALLVIEKLWNALVNVVWGAINSAIGAASGVALPVPTKF